MVSPQNNGSDPRHEVLPQSESHGGMLMPLGNDLPYSPYTAVGWPGGGGPQQPDILSAGPTPGPLLHALRRRWAMALGLGLCAGVLAMVATWFLAPKYQDAEARLRVSRVQDTVFNDGYRDPQEFDIYRRTQVALIKSPYVLQAALRQPGIAQLPVVRREYDQLEWLTDELKVDYPSDAEILRIRMRGENVEQLVRIVNAVKKAYLEEVVQRERQERLERKEKLDREYRANNTEISKKREQISRLAQELGVADSKKVILTLEQLREEMRESRMRLAQIKMQLDVVEREYREELINSKAKATEIPDAVVDREMEQDTEIREMKMNVAAIRERLGEQSSRTRRPELIRPLQAQLANAQEALEARRAELRPKIQESIEFQIQKDRKSKLELAAQTGAGLTEKHKAEEARLNALKQEFAKFGQFSADYEAREMEVESLTKANERVGTQLRALDADLKGAAPRVTSIEDAEVPEGMNMIFTYILIGAVGVGAFGATLFGVAYWEFTKRRVNSPRDVAQGLGLTVLGDLPRLSGKAWQRSMSKNGSSKGALPALLIESIDSIRTKLMHSTMHESTRTVMVTSASNYEGKTTVASQLAVSFARAGRRTLLIDCDLRKPTLHHLFETPLDPGLCEVLKGEAELQDTIRPTRAENLWLIPAGNCDSESVQSLSRDETGKIFEQLRPLFDFIVIDAAPVLCVADAMLIGQHVDGAVLSVLRDVSEIPKIYEAREQLRGVGVQVLGTVVNGVAPETARRSHYLLAHATG